MAMVRPKKKFMIQYYFVTKITEYVEGEDEDAALLQAREDNLMYCEDYKDIVLRGNTISANSDPREIKAVRALCSLYKIKPA